MGFEPAQERSQRPLADVPSSLAPSSRNPFRRGEDEHTLRIPEPLSGKYAERLGPYDVCFKLATGETADVYLGIRCGPDGFQKMVALKRLRADLSTDEVSTEELMRGARVWARANHPFVRDVFDFAKLPNGTCVLAMEFLFGEPLSVIFDEIAAHEPDKLPKNHVEAVVRAMAGLCHAVHSVHEFTNGEDIGFIHRDLTPRNLYVLHDGSVRVTELGLIRAGTRAELTKGDVVKGKVSYMSPECLKRQACDRRSDVWTLGVILWELLTGQRLFPASGLVDAFERIVAQPIPTPSSRRPNIERALEAIVMRALSRERAERYESAQELATALETFLVSAKRLVVPSDVSAWLQVLLPESLPRLTRMVELGRKMHQVLPSDRPESEHPSAQLYDRPSADQFDVMTALRDQSVSVRVAPTAIRGRIPTSGVALPLAVIVISLVLASFALVHFLGR